MADRDSAGGQDQFDIAQAEAEAVIQPHHVLNDRGRLAMPPRSSVTLLPNVTHGGGDCSTTRLHPLRMKRPPPGLINISRRLHCMDA